MSFFQKLFCINCGRDSHGKISALRILGIPCVVAHDYRKPHGEFSLNFLHGRLWRSFRKNVAPLNVPELSVLYFDHSLGGGTDSYFKYTRTEWQDGRALIRVQYILRVGVFRVSVYRTSDAPLEEYHFATAADLEKALCTTSLGSVVVSNLVGYNAPEMLIAIENIILHTCPVKVYFLCHDYFAICPSYNLMDGSRYCGAETDERKCQACIQRHIHRTWILDRNTVMPGPKDIAAWRRVWGHFLQDIATDVIAFDSSVADIFCKYYPGIRDKFSIVPHKTPLLRKVNPHPRAGGVTIAVLGNIFQIKGRDVLLAIDEVLPDYPDVEIVLLGTADVAFKHITTHGAYRVEDLPDLVETLGVQAVFIPSVCPETFSYTTSEALMMGLPTICFDLGAPANRVSMDTKGLVLPIELMDQPREILGLLHQHLAEIYASA